MFTQEQNGLRHLRNSVGMKATYDTMRYRQLKSLQSFPDLSPPWDARWPHADRIAWRKP
jgi:hypothetical protein